MIKVKRVDVPAFMVEGIVDETGAGDVFAAGFTYAYEKCRDCVLAATFANATAGMSLRFTADKLQYGYKEIIRFTKSQGREINI